jgi:uncharacterized RDD family membrane protein YckC
VGHRLRRQPLGRRERNGFPALAFFVLALLYFAAFSMLVTGESQRLGDLAAKTVVRREKPASGARV